MAPDAPASTPSVAYASPRGRGVLLTSILGSGMAFLDGTAVNVALPALGRELGAGLAGLQWAVDAYLLTLGSLVLTGGALGDVWGQRRVFLLGLVAFTATSVLCGLAPNAWTLAVFRAAQGLGAALLPVTLLLLALSPSVGRLAGRIGARPLMTVGPLLAGVGLALLTRIQRGGGYVSTVLPGVLVLGLGLALTVGPLTAVVLGAVEDRYAGIASGVNNAVARIAGLLAVALLPLLGGLAGDAGADFLAGMRRALWVSAGLCAVGALCALLTIPRQAGRGQEEPPRKPSRARTRPGRWRTRTVP